MKRTFSVFCAAALASTMAWASSAPIFTRQLANGLTVIVKPDRRAPTAVHMLLVRVGSMDEVDGTSGVAHVLEHMMFKGSDTLKAGEFSRRVAALGGRENAFTGRDMTGYFQQIPSERLSDVMALEADRFAHNRWPDEEFKKEIEVVKEERRLRTEDNPHSRLYEQLNAISFIASPYRRPVVGWMSDLDAMTPDDARAFYRRWYTPQNAALVVAGDVEPEAVMALAQRTYGAIETKAVPTRKPQTEPPQAGPRRLDFKAPADQAYLTLAFKVPQWGGGAGTSEADRRDALALTVLAAVLDGYSGARLDRALVRGADRVADSAGASVGLMGRGPQQFYLDGVPAPGKTTAQLEAALREQVAKISRDGVGEAELARVKTQWVAREVYKLDSVMAQAREIGGYWIQGLPLDTGEQVLAALRTVTAAEVQAVAGKYFGDDQLTVATLIPQPRKAGETPRKPPPGMRH